MSSTDEITKERWWCSSGPVFRGSNSAKLEVDENRREMETNKIEKKDRTPETPNANTQTVNKETYNERHFKSITAIGIWAQVTWSMRMVSLKTLIPVWLGSRLRPLRSKIMSCLSTTVPRRSLSSCIRFMAISCWRTWRVTNCSGVRCWRSFGKLMRPVFSMKIGYPSLLNLWLLWGQVAE